MVWCQGALKDTAVDLERPDRHSSDRSFASKQLFNCWLLFSMFVRLRFNYLILALYKSTYLLILVSKFYLQNANTDNEKWGNNLRIQGT